MSGSNWFGLSLMLLCTTIISPVREVNAAPQIVTDPETADTEIPDTEISDTEISGADELSQDEVRQIKTAERFLSILKKNPRRGTALDRVYGHHVEFGTLDGLIDSLKTETMQSSDDGAAWMLLGLFESQRGNDGAAADAFKQAETLRPEDALASYYLSQSQLRIGQSTEAVASMERAIRCQPPRADLLEIYQQLGRVHQRAQRTDEAMEVWQRLESLFPDDPRVLEQIAATLADEGQPAMALPRYKKLATLVTDDYRRVVYEVAAAELHIKTGNRDTGIAELEKVMSDLNPDSWLYRDVRRRIDDVFLRSGDQDNLVKYYESWLGTHPNDIDGMSRLARFLASSARMPEAMKWMEKALKLAPSRTDLRKSFIDQLVNSRQFDSAIAQYETLVESAPGNPDFLRDWGKLVLKNKEMPQEQRQQEAERIWNRMLAGHNEDAVTVSQVADLYRQNNLIPQAEGLYHQAIELAPTDPQYREYLGEFLFIQKRPDEAVKVWAGIAAEDRVTAVNLTRLAEVYNSFGFPEKAIAEIDEAVKLDPKNFNLQFRAADYHSRAAKFDSSLAYIDRAEDLAASEDEREAVLTQRIEVLQTSQQLEDASERLAAEVRDDLESTTTDWYRLARYYEAARRWADATAAIDRAIELDPKSIVALTAAARIAETSGDYGRAAATSRKLAQIDRRSRGDHLMNVSRLEAQLGRPKEALAAAKELIVSAPGNTDHYEFFAQMCFRLGHADEGLESLRKAVRINPNEPHLIMALASALGDQLRTEEAIEVYWRAYEKSDEVEDKVSLTIKLANLYQQTNQFDKLIERFERDRLEEDKRREATICLAQAWHTTGDFGAARQELESLLSEDTRDTNLLNQLAKLCQDGAELDAAIGYQRQLVAIAPGHETEFPLASMLMSNGDADEAREIFVKLTRSEEDPIRQIKAIDSLLRQGNSEAVIDVIEPLLAQSRDDWELLYREAIAWANLDKTDEATNRFERILSLSLPYESLGRSAEATWKRDQAKAKSNNLRGIASAAPQRQSPLAMRTFASQVQQSAGLVADNGFYQAGSTPPIWTPEVYGVSRMAAMGWLLKFEQDADEETGENTNKDSNKDSNKDYASAKLETDANAEPVQTQSLFDDIYQVAGADDAPRNAIYDALYAAAIKNDNKKIYAIARRLAKEGGSEEQRFFLSSLALRESQPSTSGQTVKATKTPLSEEDLQLVRDCYAALAKENKTNDLSAIYGGNIAYASNGQAYALVGGSYQMLPGVFKGEGAFLTTLVEELRLAGHEEEATKLLDEHLQQADTASELASAMSLLMQENRNDEISVYFERWQQAALKQIAAAPVEQPSRRGGRASASSGTASSGTGSSGTASAQVLATASYTIQRWLGALAAEEENERILSILDSVLEVSVAEAKHRCLVAALDTRSRQATTTNSSSQRMQIVYGKETSYVNIAFPPTSLYLDHATLTLLRQVHENLAKNDVAGDLVDRLQSRLALAKETVSKEAESKETESDQAVYAELDLAAALWWADKQDEAIESMAKVTEQLPEYLPMRFDLAAMYEQRGDFEDALTLIESIQPRDQQVLQTKEIAVLQLAERIGDIDRARAAAERLFGLRLTPQLQLSLVERMRRLGLSEMADAVVSRIERTSSNQTSSMTSLMMLYQGQGKTDKANQVAHMLLRRTSSPMSVNSRSSQNPLQYRTSESGARTQAINVLQRSGTLKDVVKQLEEQYERSPDSDKLLEQLVEFYAVTGQKDESLKLLQGAVTRRPDSPMLRLQLAKQWEQAGKSSEACDEYLAVLKLQPDWVVSQFYQINRVFNQAKRQVDLVKTMTEINLKSVRQPYYISQAASELLRDGKNVDVAMALLEKAFDDLPQYRSSFIQNFRDPKLLENPRVYAFAKKMVVPTLLDIQSNRWTGIDQIYTYSSNGEINTHVAELIGGIKATENMADFESTIRTAADANPKWLGGQAILALIELATDRSDAGRKRLTSIIDEASDMDSIPATTCWIIGQELDRDEETRPLAMTLFEKAVADPNQNNMDQMRYSPIAKLIKTYGTAGRQDESRRLLLKQLKKEASDQYDQAYASYRRLENLQWAAQQFIDLNFPVDAIRLYREILDNPESMKAASQYTSQGGDEQKKQAELGIQRALAAMKPEKADEVVAQLLAVPDEIKSNAAAIDLMVGIPAADATTIRPMDSAYVAMLNNFSNVPETKQAITERLATITEQYPNDVSIAIADADWKLQSEQTDAKVTVERLKTIVQSHPLELIAEGRRPNSRQRREAASLVPLWLIARQCLSRDDLRDAGQSLADVALAAAERQVSAKEQTSILIEWGQRLVNQGDIQGGRERWIQLLDTVTVRPTHSKKADKNSSDPAREFIPPLTISQFRVASLVGKLAAQHGMPELSRRAVKETLRGGFPVADVSNESMNARQSLQSIQVFSSSSRETPADPIETEVVQSLKRIVGMWVGADYPPAETFDVLTAMVLPENRPQEILMYVNANVVQARIDSLAEPLITSAAESNRLDELVRRLKERSDGPSTRVTIPAMQSLIAIKRGETEAAKKELAILTELSAAGLPTSDAQIAFLAAMRAFDHDELKAAAFPILRRSLEDEIQRSSADFNTGLNLSAALPRMVNGFLAATGDSQSVKDYIEKLLSSRQSYYSRFGDDYGLYQQWRDLADIAGQAASFDLPELTLELLGRAVDFDLENYPRPNLASALAAVSKSLRSATAEERYHVWKQWTLPTEGRQAIRFLAESVQQRYVPSRFIGDDNGNRSEVSPRLDSNFPELVAAAKASGNLEALRREVEPLVDAKMADAESLWGLIAIAMEDKEVATAIYENLSNSMKERSKAINSRRGKPMLWGDYLVIQACLQSEMMSPMFEHQFKQLRSRFQENSQQSLMNFFVRDWNQRVTSPAPRSADYPGLKHWISATAEKHASGQAPWWTTYENQLMHLWGPGHDRLYLRYPLTGDFTVSIDRFDESWSESSVGLDGIDINSENSRTTIESITNHESLTRKESFNLASPAFGTVTFDQRDSKLSYSINGQAIYEEQAATTSPWLTLSAWDIRLAALRDLRIEGEPIIPREVALIGNDRLDGWDCSAFGESQPRHRLMAETPENENSPLAYNQKREPAEFDWNAVDGVLTGSAKDAAGLAPNQSWIQYARPLVEADQVSYEFFYVPGQSVAHPTIGGVAMMLQPDGVTSHWVTVPEWDGVVAIPADNSIVEAECRRGPETVPLKPNEWNQVSVKLSDSTAVVSVNGELVFQRNLEKQLSTRFGIFRYQNQATQVRKVVLSGDWPTNWNDALVADITELEQPLSNAQRLEIGTIVDDIPIALTAGEVVRMAREEEPEKAYAMLKSWVLPSPDHVNTRMHYSVGPPHDDTVFANLLCPAVELVRIADELGKLDELSAALSQLGENNSGQDIHNRNALRGVISLQSGDDAGVRLALQQAWKLLRDHSTDDWTSRERAAEFVLAWLAAHTEPYRTASLDITRELRWAERDGERKSGDDKFSRYLHALFGDIERSQRFTTPENEQLANDGITQWQAVPYMNPNIRWKKFRPSTWIGAKGSLQHMPSETWSQLYFQSPLRGKFTVQAEHSTYDHEEVSISYGEHAAQPNWDLNGAVISTVMHGSRHIEGDVKLPHWDHRARTRFEVDGRKITTFTNGVQVHEERLQSSPDPWLMLQTQWPTDYATVTNLRITGNPEIPDQIDLIDINGLSGWRADIYGSWHSTDPKSNAPWMRDGDELVGSIQPNSQAKNVESLMRYQRPMLEDGVIEMECWYEPGVYEAHPAVGRDAFLISPDGLRLHRMTDAQFEATGLAADNVSDIEGAADRLPLQEKDWNRVRLKWVGNRLTITVNDVDAASVEMTAPLSERQFGLFRYVNQTKCRVRNLIYRGDWPKTLPAIDDQDLASPSEGSFALSGTPTILDSLAAMNADGFQILGPSDRMTEVPDGVHLSLQERKGTSSQAGVIRHQLSSGDLQITADYKDLKMTPVKEGWGIVLGLRFEMNDLEQSVYELQLSLDDENRLVSRVHVTQTLPDGQEKYHAGFHLHDATPSGRLRMIRRDGQVHCLTASADSDDFRWLAAFPVGSAAIEKIEFGCNCSDEVATADVTLERLSIIEPE